MTEHHPTFATNRPASGETVAAAISAHLDWVSETWKKDFEVAIATAYVNPGGFRLIADALDKASKVRLLIGAEPPMPEHRVRRLAEDRRGSARRALEDHERSLEEDRDLLGFTIEADRDARRFVDWLCSGAVETRRYESGFLHGKAFMVSTDDEGVIAGSSNFTFAGLSTNLELNLGHYDPPTVRSVHEWFEEVWASAKPYDLAALYAARFELHTPYLIYLRMLWEKYGAEVEALAKADPYGLQLAPFQKDGVTLSRLILDRYSGVVVADGVGLGKTFIAGELIREAVEDNRQRVLVVAPAALRDGPWRAFKDDQAFNFEVVSFDQLREDHQLSPDGSGYHLRHDKNEYALVVIDEAHAFRSLATKQAEALNRLLEGSPPKKLVMLTATPVNNSLWDLYNLLAYFVRSDATFASAGVPSLRERFKQAASIDPESLDPNQLYDVLSPVVVRRTRAYVKHYYPNQEITINGVKQHITFPQADVRPVEYELAAAYPGLLDKVTSALDLDGESVPEDIVSVPVRNPGKLTLGRYAPSAYKIGLEEVEQHEVQVTGLLRSNLLKRLESSAHAFAQTCRKMAASHDDFLGVLSTGWVATGEALKELTAADSDEIEDLIEAKGEDWFVTPAGEYDVESLRADVERDRDRLLSWAEEAEKVRPEHDPKLRALEEQLTDVIRQAAVDVHEPSAERDRRKVVIFSYFADTVDWIFDRLRQVVDSDDKLAPYRDRLVAVSGNVSEKHEQDALFGFAPTTTDAPGGESADLFDVMVTTDVLAEGVNLQQARNVINYDLPWNPMRLVQRHGRVDRIGSPHSKIYVRCFMPDDELDHLLHLEARLHTKIIQAARTIGTEGHIIPGSEISDRAYSETREVIEEIRRRESGFLDEPEGAASIEEFRQQLRTGLQNPLLAGRMKELAWGSGSAKRTSGDELGFVFCARVGDNRDPFFRYVSGLGTDQPVVVPDVLACLNHALATETTPAEEIDEATYEAAYRAWAAAKEDIFRTWQHATDIRNLQPEIPKVMRDAAELVRTDPPQGMEQADVDALYDTLNAPYSERVRKPVRDIMRSDVPPAEKAAQLAQVVERLALTQPDPPQPLPTIASDEVYLICWMALVPQT